MLKCGIVGCGVIAPTHIEGFQAIPEVKITCLCDLELEKAKKLGETSSTTSTSVPKWPLRKSTFRT